MVYTHIAEVIFHTNCENKFVPRKALCAMHSFGAITISRAVMRESYGLQTSNSVVNIFAKFASKFEANFIFKMERTRNAVRIAFFQNNGANLAVRFYMKKSEFQRIFQYFQFKLC